jgi:hypothetical protein
MASGARAVAAVPPKVPTRAPMDALASGMQQKRGATSLADYGARRLKSSPRALRQSVDLY